MSQEKSCYNCAMFDQWENYCYLTDAVVEADAPMPCGGEEWESDEELEAELNSLEEALANPPWCKKCHKSLTYLAATTGGWHCSRCNKTFYASHEMGHGDPSSASGQGKPKNSLSTDDADGRR